MYNHVMLDLETLGERSKAVITSVGGVLFDPDLGPEPDIKNFYHTIDIQDSLNHGLQVTGATLKWWFHQDPVAAQRMFVDTKPLKTVLEDFTIWLNFHGGHDLYIWGKSPRFDIGLLEDAYHVCELEIPWDFRKERDVRTYIGQVPRIKECVPKNNRPHEPESDALYQISSVCEARRYIKISPPVLQLAML
jgi:hypothetical protein